MRSSRLSSLASLVCFGSLAIATTACSHEIPNGAFDQAVEGAAGGGGSSGSADPSTTSSTGGASASSSSGSVSSSDSSSSTGSGAGGSGAGGTGAGGSAAPSWDTCPGEAQMLDVGVTLTLGGSTVGASADHDAPAASCFGAPNASGADVVYAVTFGAAGTLDAHLTTSNGLVGVLSAETSCGQNSTIVMCSKVDTSEQVHQTLPVAANQTLYFVVDGDAGTAGDYSLRLSLAGPHCGDGIVNPGEQCDDGNNVSGDGCSATCTIEAPTDNSEACPGDMVAIALNQTLDIKGTMAAPIGEATTLNYGDSFTTCDGIVYGSPTGSGPDQNGNDRVFQFVPSSSGTLTLQLRNIGADGGFDGMLSAWANTCAPTAASASFDWTTGTDPANGDYMGCSDHAYGDQAWNAGTPDDPMTQESLTFAVTAGTPYFVVVDGYAGYSAGEFWLNAVLKP